MPLSFLDELQSVLFQNFAELHIFDQLFSPDWSNEHFFWKKKLANFNKLFSFAYKLQSQQSQLQAGAPTQTTPFKKRPPECRRFHSIPDTFSRSFIDSDKHSPRCLINSNWTCTKMVITRWACLSDFLAFASMTHSQRSHDTLSIYPIGLGMGKNRHVFGHNVRNNNTASIET